MPNWLDAAGHREGVIQYRWIWTQTNPAPRVRIVKLEDFRKELPTDTPFISAAMRREIVRKRQDHIARREQL